MMKITLALLAILAIIGLGQSHQFPDFGHGPLHDDIQDILDLVPVRRIIQVVAYYAKHDQEVQAAINFLATTPTFKNLFIDFESYPETINFLNYLHNEGIEIYSLINQINRALEIKELVPPGTPTPIPSDSTPMPSESTATPSVTSPTATPTEPSSPPPPSEPSSSSVPTSASTAEPTSSPVPTSTSTAGPTSSPVPTSASTAGPTSSPVPTSTSTAGPTSSPVSTSASTAGPTSSPVPTSTSTAGPTSSPVPTSASTAGPTSSPVPTSTSNFFYKYNGIKIRTGGLAGLFNDVKRLFNYDAFISVYVDKLKHSSAFGGLVNEIKSENFQVMVNKIFESQSTQVIYNYFKDKVNLKIVGDILYLVFGVNVPDHVKSLGEHFVDFFELLPAQEMADIVVKYLNEDKEVNNAILFLTSSEFHDLLRAVEALKEHQAFVVYLQKHGVNIIQYLKEFHKAINMEDYVPPKIENFLKAQITTQEVGSGFKGMIADLYSLLPFEKIDALFQEKLRTSKIFSDFYAVITSPEFKNLYNNLAVQEPVKQFITKSNEKGLDFVAFHLFAARIIGLKLA